MPDETRRRDNPHSPADRTRRASLGFTNSTNYGRVSEAFLTPDLLPGACAARRVRR